MPPKDRDLTPYSIHAVACVLKLFLRELKEPLLTFPLYEKFVNIEKEVAKNPDSEGNLNRSQLQIYKNAISSLTISFPTLKVCLFIYFDFLIF